MVTAEPRSICRPAPGRVSITSPSSTLGEVASSSRTRKPASSSFSRASSAGSPTTSGTLTSPGPCETVRVTVEPSSAWVRGPGS